MINELIQFDQYLLKKLIQHSDTVQAITVSFGIIIGGIWTYLLFVRQRLHYPKVKINLDISSINLEDSKKLVHTEAIIENIGCTLLRSNYAELRLRQILPIQDNNLRINISKGFDPVKNDCTEIEWPCIVQRTWKNQFEIEPGESDTLHADFFIDSTINITEFYFFMKNKNKKRNIGWTLTKIHNFNREDNMAERYHGDQQERQQPQEQKQQQQQPRQTQQQTKLPEQETIHTVINNCA